MPSFADANSVLSGFVPTDSAEEPNFSLPVFTGGGGSSVPNPVYMPVFATVISALLCPSDPGPAQYLASLALCLQ